MGCYIWYSGEGPGLLLYKPVLGCLSKQLTCIITTAPCSKRKLLRTTHQQFNCPFIWDRNINSIYQTHCPQMHHKHSQPSPPQRSSSIPLGCNTRENPWETADRNMKNVRTIIPLHLQPKVFYAGYPSCQGRKPDPKSGRPFPSLPFPPLLFLPPLLPFPVPPSLPSPALLLSSPNAATGSGGAL